MDVQMAQSVPLHPVSNHDGLDDVGEIAENPARIVPAQPHSIEKTSHQGKRLRNQRPTDSGKCATYSLGDDEMSPLRLILLLPG